MTSPPLYHAVQCPCGYYVRAEDLATVNRLAEKHSKTCGMGVRQMTRTTPFIAPEGDESNG